MINIKSAKLFSLVNKRTVQSGKLNWRNIKAGLIPQDMNQTNLFKVTASSVFMSNDLMS